MLKHLFLSFRTVSRTHTARPCFRPFATRTKLSSSLKPAWGRAALVASFSLAGAAIFLQQQNKILLDAHSPDASSPLKAESGAMRKDSATGIEFPETLVIPSRVRLPPFQLLGLGVRTVSFLRMKVYTVAFYADLSNLKIPENMGPEEKIEYVISNSPCVLRIVPTRNTSYSHLRDGFIRALQARMSTQLKDGSLSAQIAEEAQSPLRKLKSMFPSSPLKKGEPLDILLLPPPKKAGEARTLVIRDLGSVENDWVANEFVRAYFGGDGLSPPMKASVIEYLQSPRGLLKD